MLTRIAPVVLFLATICSSQSTPNPSSPPKYPSPWLSPARDWESAYEKARDFVGQLTLLEKVNLTTGVGWQQEQCVGNVGSIPRLGFRSLCMQDSPLGVRFTDYNTAFPAGVNVAATWDRGLMYARGYAMGAEHRAKGVNVQLGPVAGPIGRHPEGGRNWEGFSPDPVLTGIGMAQTIKGIQDAGTIACAKHFIGNEQEHFRSTSSSNIDDVTMHELYLWPFADSVRAGVGSIMCSYNLLNNSYACQNSYALNYLLKSELDFQGFVMSDWGAHHSGVGAALAGLDMSMPGDMFFGSGVSYWGASLTRAVMNGSVPEWRIDDMAVRIMAAYYKVGQDQTNIPTNFDSWTLDTYGYQHFLVREDYTLVNQHVDVRNDPKIGSHAALAREVAAKSVVLLKNFNNTLPLKKPRQIAVIGEDAGEAPYGPNGCADRGCDSGTLAMGWGSGTANFPYLVTPLTGIQNRALLDGSVLSSVTDNYAYSQINTTVSTAEVAIVFVNADSGEEYITVDKNTGDRNNLTFWGNGDRLISTVAANNKNTVVVMHTVGPVIIEPWVNHPNITAILWAGLPGEQSGNSIADILYGYVNPGAKLPFTMGKKSSDWGVGLLYDSKDQVPQITYKEGVFIDYRAFDKADIEPTYEFGYGLSYTTFNYSNLRITKTQAGPYVPMSGNTKAAPILGNSSTNPADYQFPPGFNQIERYIYPWINLTNSPGNQGPSDVPDGARDRSPQRLPPAGGSPGGNAQLYDVLYEVTATVTNTGSVAGEEVAQVYISLGGPNDPKIMLRGFERLSIQPGGSASFTVDLTRRDLSNWDPASQDWIITNYAKTVYVGSSSRKLPLQMKLG
ncbi:MAG: hypothetical protein M1839_000820 [Geoglossum umbratile]|nr:MAG: hypothetical protein M1839_000820 [Geoglossum umbratile]